MNTQLFCVGQHPHDVARACVMLIKRDQDKPLTNTIAKAVLAVYRRNPRDRTGKDAPAALHAFARQHIAYTREPHSEYVGSLRHTMATGAGDCDDMTVAVGTIARAVGFNVWACWRWTGPGMAHVYPVLGASWLPEEVAAQRRLPPGPRWNCDPFLPRITTTFEGRLLPCQ